MLRFPFRLRRRRPSACPDRPAAEQLIALGGRRLADLIAPAALEVRRDHVRLDAHYARVLVVTGYPRSVSPGWLAPLVEGELPIEVSLHIRPLPSAAMVRSLGLQIARLQSSLSLRRDRPADPAVVVGIEDAERLRDRLQRGEERVFSTSLYLLLRAPSRQALDDLTRRVEAQLDGLLAQSRVALFEQERGFHSCLTEARDQLLVPRNLDTTSLATSLPLAGPSLLMEGGVLYGVSTQSQTPVIVDPFDASLDNYNSLVVAPTGSGKSYFTKLLALRNRVAGVDFLVVDPHDEYGPVAAAVGGQLIRLAPSSPHRLNPFDLPPPAPDEEDPLAERVAALLGWLEVLLGAGGPPRPLGAEEQAVLDRALYETYALYRDGRRLEGREAAERGITPDPSTRGRTVPLLRDLYAALGDMPGDVAAGLASRLRRYVEGSLAAGLFAGPTNVALDNPFVVFQLGRLDEALWPMAIHLIASHVWAAVRTRRRARLLVVDEAGTLLPHPMGGAFLAGVSRKARKFYLGLVALTQSVADFEASAHGRTVLANAALSVLLKHDDKGIDAAEARFRLTPDERQFLLGAAQGEGLLFARGSRVRLQSKASPIEHRLVTTNPREIEELAATGHLAPGALLAGAAA